MTVKKWLERTYKKNPDKLIIRQRAVCKDGFSLSIQAGRCFYCSPRETRKDGRYHSVEIGYPSSREEMLEPYEEDGIYPYVPMETAEETVKKHGGIIWAV